MNAAFPSILQNAWAEILKDNNVMLILSGFFIGMMQKHALSYDSPLYGRRTSQMRLVPLWRAFFLLKSESMTAVNYFSVIKAIADSNHKIGKIARVLDQGTSRLTPYISTLVDLGFVEARSLSVFQTVLSRQSQT